MPALIKQNKPAQLRPVKADAEPGWDLSQVHDSYLTAELCRRGFRPLISPGAKHAEAQVKSIPQAKPTLQVKGPAIKGPGGKVAKPLQAPAKNKKR